MLKSYLREIMAEYKIDDISELMDKTGVSRNSINKLYREVEIETIKLETLMKICDSFNIRLSDLVEYIPNPLIEEESEVPIEEITQQIHEVLVRGVQRNLHRKASTDEIKDTMRRILNKNKP